MKKVITSLLTLTALTTAQISMAVPGNISIRLNCPDIANKGKERVSNYGPALTGAGTERVATNPPTFPIFAGANPGGVPIDLVSNGYTTSGTSYDPTTGLVTCHYKSPMATPPFDLIYQLKNALGGIITKSTDNEISIKFLMGVTT